MVAKEVTITLDDEILTFIDRQAAALGPKANRSAYINTVLLEQQQKHSQLELEAAYRRDVEDATYQEEILAWDALTGDGIDA